DGGPADDRPRPDRSGRGADGRARRHRRDPRRRERCPRGEDHLPRRRRRRARHVTRRRDRRRRRRAGDGDRLLGIDPAHPRARRHDRPARGPARRGRPRPQRAAEAHPRVNAFLRRVFGFKAGEERALVASFLCFFFLMFGYYLLRPFRDALGLGRGTEKLPWYFTATFGGICVAVPIYSALAARFPRHRLIAIAYRFFAANLVLFWAGFALGAQSLLAPVFFVWVSVYNLFVVSLFWSFMADVWSTVDAKRLFGAVAAGGSAGAILGPTVTGLLAQPIGPPQLLLIAAVTLEISVQCARRLGAPPSKAVGGGILAGFINVARSPYLLGIGAQILCFAVTSTVLYTQQAAYVAQAFPDTAAR